MFLMDLFNGTLFDNPIVAAGTDGPHHGMARILASYGQENPPVLDQK